MILAGGRHGVDAGADWVGWECPLYGALPRPERPSAVRGILHHAAAGDRAWQRAESRVAQGQLGEPGSGRQPFRDYAEKTWLPNHEVEATTRQTYSYILRKHILPEFGPMRIIDILPEHVREWVARLKAGGVKPPRSGNASSC